MVSAKKIFDFYLNSSIHVALAVTSFAGITMLIHDLNMDHNLLFFIFFGTITGYNFVKYSGVAKFQHFNLSVNLKIIQVFSLLCFLVLIYYALKQPVYVILATVFLGLLTLLYSLPVFSNSKNLRSFTGVKIFVIAFVWAGVTVILPALEPGLITDEDICVEFVQRTMFVIVLTIPFDIRDIHFDSDQLGTIPQIFGVKKARTFGISLLIAVLMSEFFKQVTGISEIMVLVLIILLTAFLIQKSVIRQRRYFASFWVESVPVLWLIFLVLTEIFVSNVSSG